MEKVKLGDVLLYEQPTKYIVESDRYNNDFEIPVLTAGKSFLLGYTNEKTGIFNDLPVIIFDDFTTAIKFVDFPFKVKSSAMKILKPNKEKADIRYLYYKMLTIKTDNEQHKRYWISKFANIQISLPTLSEQKTIAAKLDKAQEIISYNKQLLEKYDQLTQSLFIDMFGDPGKNEKGWEIKLAEDLIYLQTGFPFKSDKYSENKDDIKLCGGLIIMPSKIDWNNANHWNVTNMTPKIEEYWLDVGDIVMAMDRPWISSGFKIRRIVESDPKSLLVQRTARIKGLKVNQTFLFYILNSIEFKNHTKLTETTVPHLSPKDIKTFKMISPPVTLQNQFSERIEKIDAQKQMAQESLAKSEALFQSLLQESFK